MDEDRLHSRPIRSVWKSSRKARYLLVPDFVYESLSQGPQWGLTFLNSPPCEADEETIARDCWEAGGEVGWIPLLSSKPPALDFSTLPLLITAVPVTNV